MFPITSSTSIFLCVRLCKWYYKDTNVRIQGKKKQGSKQSYIAFPHFSTKSNVCSGLLWSLSFMKVVAFLVILLHTHLYWSYQISIENTGMQVMSIVVLKSSKCMSQNIRQVFAILVYNSIESTNRVTVGHKQSYITAFQKEFENEFQYCISKNIAFLNWTLKYQDTLLHAAC